MPCPPPRSGHHRSGTRSGAPEGDRRDEQVDAEHHEGQRPVGAEAVDAVAAGPEEPAAAAVRSTAYPPRLIDLPAGFTYTPGSTTGATTNDPTVSIFSGAQFLQWNQNLLVPAGGAITIAIAARTSSVVGDHDASGGRPDAGLQPSNT